MPSPARSCTLTAGRTCREARGPAAPLILPLKLPCQSTTCRGAVARILFVSGWLSAPSQVAARFHRNCSAVPPPFDRDFLIGNV
jgi:hypothetical protein